MKLVIVVWINGWMNVYLPTNSETTIKLSSYIAISVKTRKLISLILLCSPSLFLALQVRGEG